MIMAATAVAEVAAAVAEVAAAAATATATEAKALFVVADGDCGDCGGGALEPCRGMKV